MLSLGHKAEELRSLWRGMAEVHRATGRGRLAMLRDYRRFRWAIGASPTEFFSYRLWDDGVPMAERVTFLTWAVRRPLEAYMNPKAVAVQVQSKVEADRRFRALGLPVPRLLAMWCPPGVTLSHPAAVGTAEALWSAIRDAPNGVVCKRDTGGGGEFVRVFRAVEGEVLVHASGERWPLSRLVQEMRGGEPWLVQERVRSHPECIALNGHDDISTYRLVTCRRKDGRVFLINAIFKMPVTGTGVDNLSDGNAAAGVDGEGRLSDGILGTHGRRVDVHPVSGVRFVGRVVPLYHESVAMVLAAHQHFAELSSLGWDIAITPDGPLLIEANAWWGAVVQQAPLVGMVRGEFIDYVAERGALHLLRMDRRRAMAGSSPPRPSP